MPGPISMKLGMYIKPLEAVSMAYIINPSHHYYQQGSSSNCILLLKSLSIHTKVSFRHILKLYWKESRRLALLSTCYLSYQSRLFPFGFLTKPRISPLSKALHIPPSSPSVIRLS
jgi:hypothetical protein